MSLSPGESEKVIKNALEEMFEGLQIVDEHWRYIYVNQAVVDQGRMAKEDLLGRTMMECYPGIEDTSMFEELQYVMETRKPRRFENQFEFSDGSKVWFELFLEPHSKGVLVRSVDITERKRLEDQLRHSQKMEAVGLLAGGLAHDFNNKLGVMLINCQMALEKVAGSQKSVERFLNNILSSIWKSNSITKQLLAFSRKQVMDLKVVNPNSLIQESKDTLKTLIGEHIDMQFDLDPETANVRVDPNQLDQVLLNLCINARDAMPKGGTITVETANVYLDQNYTERRVDVRPGYYTMIAVSDTGEGMDRETRNQIFDPFFTTKGQDRGTGLGLATVHGIVKQLKGHIWVYSEKGMGCVFKIYLPIVTEKSEAWSVRSISEVRYEGNEGILLVEDDPLLREAFEASLNDFGYTVFSASSSDEASTLFKSHQGEIDLVLTDLVLPQKNGKNLADELVKQKTSLKVIYMSGYTENTIVHNGVLDTEAILLQKPISVHNLLSTVRATLDEEVKKAVVDSGDKF